MARACIETSRECLITLVQVSKWANVLAASCNAARVVRSLCLTINFTL